MTLRGGGVFCSHPSIVYVNVPHSSVDDKLLMFFKDVGQKCAEIQAASNKIDLQESKDQIIDKIKWFSYASQFMNHLNRDPYMLNENIILMLDNLKLLLRAIQSLIRCQTPLALQLLNICNQFSRLIFIYCVKNPQFKISSLEQTSTQLLLKDIQQQAKEDQQNAFQSTFYYQYLFISMCIDDCPTETQSGQDMTDSFSGFVSSITEMAPSSDLLEFLGKDYKKNQKQQIFKTTLYFEELKWQIIEELQNGIGINKIIAIMSQNYKQLVLKSNIWIIKCGWIKIICELIIYKTLITKTKYDQLITQYQLTESWEEAVQQQLINLIDSNQNIGIISNKNVNNRTYKILNVQFNKLEQFKMMMINGHQDIPKLQDLILDQSNEGQDMKDNQDVNQKFYQQLDSLPIKQIQQQYQSFILNLQDYSDGVQEILSENDQNANIFYDQIEQLIIINQQLVSQQKELNLNGQILSLQLFSISKTSKVIKNDQQIDKYLLFCMFLQYFEAIENNQSIIDFDEQLQQFIEKLKSHNCKILINASSEIQQIIKQQQQSNIKQIIIYIKQQLQKYKFDLNNQPLHKLSIFIHIQQDFQQIFEQEIRDTLINHQIILQTIKQTRNVHKVQKLEHIKFYQLFYFLYQMNTFNNISIILKDLKFDENTMTELQFNNLSDFITIDFQQYSLDIEDLIHSKNLILDQMQNISKLSDIQENLENLSKTLKHIKQLFIKYEKWLQEFIQHIENYKNILNQMIQSSSQQEPQIIKQLKQNYQQIINLSNKQLDSQDLSQIIAQRIEIFKNFRSDVQNQDLERLIDKEISFYNFFLNYDQIQQVSEQIMIKIELNQIQIIQIIQNQQKDIAQNNDQQEQILQKYIFYFDQLITIIRKLAFLMEKAQLGFQQSSSLVFQLSQFEYSNQSSINDKFMKINQQYNESFQQTRAIVDQNIKEVQQILNFNPNLLPPIQISDEIMYQLFPCYKKLSGSSINVVEKQNHLQQDDNWKVKEYFYVSCINIHSQISNQAIKQTIGQLILYGKYEEIDTRIISTFKNKNFLNQMQLIISNYYEDTKNQIHSDLQKSLNLLQVLQLQFQGEERKLERNKILQQHKQIEQKIEQQMQNVTEISDVLGISMHFLKEIRKELGLIQNKLDNFIDSIEKIGQDIKFLKGKSPQQLLEIRMEQVLQNQIVQDALSVYVQILTKVYKPENEEDDEYEQYENQKENQNDEQTPLFNYNQINTGEVDEFLNQDSISSLLIHGPAGSGKSLTARKIEELLWKQYQQKVNYQGWDKITQEFIIPIFIYLPSLKEPSFQAIEETLKSSEYKFDQKQIGLFRDIVQGSDKIKLLFIMDSYDELAKDYQQINLIQTNNINQWKKQTSKRNPKVITTSRSEIFINQDYRPWFFGDDKLGLKGFKEIRLLPFDEMQKNEYMHQFAWLQLKLLIFDLMEIIIKKKQQDTILQDTTSIFNQIKPLIQNKQQSYLVNNLQAQQVLNIIKQHPDVIAINNDQEISFNKQLQAIWSAYQYIKNIQQVDKDEDLDNPFLISIVAEVIPQMNEKFSQQNYVKSQFQHAYVQNKQAQITSIIKMHSYENQQILQMYDDIKQLQKANESVQEIKKESINVWEYLVNNNFFKQFNASQGQKEILQIFTNIQNQTKIQIPYSILKKERDADNQIVIYKALTTKNQSLFDFYQVFLQNYIEKHIQKQAHNSQTNDSEQFKQEIYQFAQGLAVTLTKSNSAQIEMKSLKQTEKNNQQDTDSQQYANHQKLLIKCLPIKYKSNYISFNHRSIQEFLYAKDIINLLYQININYRDNIQQLRKQKKDEDSNIYNPIKAKVREFIQQSSLNYVQIGNLPQVIKFVKAAIQNNLELQDACYYLVLLSSIFYEFIFLSSNALVILVNVLLCITDKDFSRIVIENINLDGMIFINCNFNESKFKKVSIIGINLNYSNLSKANWIDCYSSDMHTLKCPPEVNCLSICISRLDKLIFCGCSDGCVRIWDRQQGRLLKQIDTRSIGVIYVSQSDDGYRFMTVSQFYDQEYWLQFWDFDSFKLTAQEQTLYQINCNLISHSKHYVVFPKIDKSLQAYDYVLQKNIKSSFMFEHNIQNLQIKKDTTFVYIVQITEGKIIIWDFYNYNVVQKIQFTQLFEEIEMNISCNQFTWDCQLYSYRYNSKFVIFNTETEQNIEIKYSQDKIINFYFSEDKKYIAFTESNGFSIMDAQTQKFLTTPQLAHYSGISCLKFNRQSQYLITCGHDSLIKFWDIQMLLNQQNRGLQNLTEKREQYAQYSQDGQKLYVQMNNRLCVYDPFTGQMSESFGLVFDKFVVRPNGKQIIYHTKQCKTYLYDLILLQEQELKIKAQQILTQSNDGNLFFYQKFDTQSVFYIVIFDETNLSIKQQSQEIEADFGQFSYDSKSLYYLDQQEIKEIKINVDGHHEINIFQQGKFLLKHRGIINFQFTRDCKKLVLLDIDYKLYVWDTVLLKDISDLGKWQSNIQIQILSKYLLIFEDNIVVFEMQKFKQVGIKLAGHKTGIYQQIISPSGLQFCTLGKDDNAIKVWDLNKQETNLTKAFVERLIIPQQLNQNALVNNCDFKECEIISHSGYNLGNIWAEQ